MNTLISVNATKLYEGLKMSKYTELVAGKNRFFDCLIDKYNEDPKEGKKEFILQYLDKCSLFEDFIEFGIGENDTSYYSFHTYVRNTNSRSISELSIDRMLQGKKDEDIIVRITNNNNKTFTFSNKEYYQQRGSTQLNYNEPWINKDTDEDIYYDLPKCIKRNLSTNTKRNYRVNESFQDFNPYYLNLDIKPGELTVLAGRPCMGKTTLAINLALNEIKNGGKVLYLSLNDTVLEISKKMLGIKAGVSYRNIIDREFSDEQYKRIVDNIDDLKGIYFVECNYYNINQIKRTINNSVIQPTLIVIDDFEYIHYEENYPKSSEEFEYIAKELKNMAEISKTKALITEKVARSVEYRENKRPLYLSDLVVPELGKIASKVYSVYRKSYYRYEKGYIESCNDDINGGSANDEIELIDIKDKKTIKCNCDSDNIIERI